MKRALIAVTIIAAMLAVDIVKNAWLSVPKTDPNFLQKIFATENLLVNFGFVGLGVVIAVIVVAYEIRKEKRAGSKSPDSD